MKWISLLIIILAFTFIGGYIIKLIMEHQIGKGPIWRSIVPFIGVFVVCLLKIGVLMPIVGLYTTEILMHNGYYRYTLTVTINGEQIKLKPRQNLIAQTTAWRNTIKFDTPVERIDTTVKKGTYVLSSGSDLFLKVKEKVYTSLSTGETSSQKLRTEVNNGIVQLCPSVENCIVLEPNDRAPSFIDPKYKGKRIFELKTERK